MPTITGTAQDVTRNLYNGSIRFENLSIPAADGTRVTFSSAVDILPDSSTGAFPSDFELAPGRYRVSASGKSNTFIVPTGGATYPLADLLANAAASSPVNVNAWVSLLDQSGVDASGTADSTTAFLDAVNATPTGGALFVPSGTYLISAQAITRSNITIFGNGTLKCKDFIGSNGQWLTLTGSSVKISGITLDGSNKTSKLLRVGDLSTDWLIYSCRFKNAQMNTSTGPNTSTVDMVLMSKGVRDISIERCKFTDATSTYAFPASSGLGAIRCIRAGISPASNDWTNDRFDDIRISNCDFYNVGPDQDQSDAIVIQNNPANSSGEQIANVLIEGCKFLNIGRRAIKLECGGATVVGNKIYITRAGGNPDWMFSGISVYGPQTVVSGNNIHGGSTFYGIEVTSLPTFGRARGVTVTGNTITGNSTCQAASFGITVKGALDSSISDNTINNFRFGIALLGNCESLTITGNISESPSLYGIYVAADLTAGTGYTGTPARITIGETSVNNAGSALVWLNDGTDINCTGTTGSSGSGTYVFRNAGVTGESKANINSIETVIAKSGNASYQFQISASASAPHVSWTGPFSAGFYTYDDNTKIHSLWSNATHFVNTAARWAFTRTARTPLALTYATSVAIDFTANDIQTLALTGNVTFTGSGMFSYTRKMLIVTADSSSRTLAWPAWTAIGSALPASLAANKTLIVDLSSTGTTAASVLATWSVQP